MKKLMIAVGSMMMGMMAWAGASFAYQGVLQTVDGTGASTPQTITFRLYKTATGATSEALWGRKAAVTLSEKGLFNVEISDNLGEKAVDEATTLDQVLSDNADSLYIGLEVDKSAGEITPRQKVIPAPVAAYAQNVKTTLGDFTVNGTLTVEGTIKMAKENASLEAQQITSSGAVLANGGMSVQKSLTVAGGANLNGTVKVNGTEVNLPIGAIIMWSGASIPDGWTLCNGEKVTVGDRTITPPDLRDRFIVGSGSGYVIGATGGEATHTLTKDEMPSHTHEFTLYTYDIDNGWKNQDNLYTPAAHREDFKHTTTTTAAGGDRPHENRPPYYALAFIMKIR